MTDIILCSVCIQEKECHVIVKGIDLETSPVGLDSSCVHTTFEPESDNGVQ